MGKNKNKDQVPNPNNVANRDIIQRLNFLYQASVLLNTIPSSRSQSLQRNRNKHVTPSELSRSYIDTMKTVGQKTNVKIDPSVKRRLCKGCSSVLVPGMSAKVRVKNSTSHGHLISYICLACHTHRRIPAPPVLSSDPQYEPDSAMESSQSQEAERHKLQHGRKRGPKPRLLPHFARDIGHVVFRGNEIISGMNPDP
ncbi:RNAse P Rpr2/Rpp21/SNM1 subunit domain-containing protein [Scleroderma yunnanense]